MVTYGCSFTNYYWSTWADILAENLDLKLVNRGLDGCGNNFISARINHDVKSGLIEKDDVVRIMWCYYNRISDFNNLEGITKFVPPTQKKSEMIKNFHTNLNIMLQCQEMLKGNDYEFMLWLPFTQDSPAPSGRYITPKEIKNFPWQEKFEKTIHPPLVDIVMQGRLLSRIDHAVFNNDLPPIILKNLKRLAKKEKKSPLELIRQQARSGDGRSAIFFDYHPTPLMHLEYLQAIYPKMKWKTALLDKIHRENQEVLNTFYSAPIKVISG